MEIALLLGLIILNGLFAMSEIALMTARKGRLTKLAEAGDGAAKAALLLGNDPNKFLSTIQIGITSIGVMNGIVGEATLAKPFSIWLQSFGTSVQAADYAATGLVVVVITYFSIVLGELVPKAHCTDQARAIGAPGRTPYDHPCHRSKTVRQTSFRIDTACSTAGRY